ncbi:increased rDNA silencing protein [Trichoderma barbatum]
MKPDSAAAAAAIRGATLAFRRDKLEVEQRAEGGAAGRRDNGAYTAATEAVRGRAEVVADGRTQHQQQQHQQMDGMVGGGGASSAAFGSLAGRMDAKSQSLIAATLAASRSASPTASGGGSANASINTAVGGGGGEAVDSGPLASAGSLISMFEKARGRPSPPESVGSSVEDRTDKVKKKGKAADKGDGPPTPPVARSKTKARRDLVAEAGPDDKSRGPGGDGRAKPKMAAEAAGVSASSITQRHQQHQHQQSHSHSQQSQQQQPARLTDNKAVSSPPRPMTPTPVSTTASQPSTPAPSSEPKSSQARQRAHHPSTPPPLKPLMSRNVAEVVSPQPTRVSRAPLSPVTSPHLTLSPSIHIALASPSPDPPKKSRGSAAKQPPTPPKPRGSGKDGLDKDKDQPARRGRSYSNHLDAASSKQTRTSIGSAVSRSAGQSVSPSSQNRESRPSSVALGRRHSTVSVPSSPSRELASQRRFANVSPGRTQLDNLTDAIVAGSLASARLTPHNTGPVSLAPPPLPKRQKSPRLLPTLRHPHLLDEDEDQHKKGHRALLRKGKHAHHEGSRKKWREEIRPRERKRYEALWASNRGILLTNTRIMSPATSISSDLDRDVSQCVANVTVREVWRRSRLPVDELAEIYDLVDRGRAGMLSRAEFVVGTWLVDQRLKGRKVPAKVTDSVWGSANGVMVKGPNGK